MFTQKNLHDTYPLNPHQVRDRLEEGSEWKEISWPKTKAIIKELNLLNNDDFHREDISLGAGDSREGYHGDVVTEVVDVIRNEHVDPETTWEKHKSELWGF